MEHEIGVKEVVRRRKSIDAMKVGTCLMMMVLVASSVRSSGKSLILE
jgi:hypothetical protein